MTIKFNEQLQMSAKIVGIECLKADSKFIQSEFSVLVEVNLTGRNNIGDSQMRYASLKVVRTQEDSTTSEINYYVLENKLPDEWAHVFVHELMSNSIFKKILHSSMDKFIDIIKSSI